MTSPTDSDNRVRYERAPNPAAGVDVDDDPLRGVNTTSAMARMRSKCAHVHPGLVAIFLVYLVQGVTDLASLAQEYFMKDELGATPSQLAAFNSALGIPWMVKPLIGFLSDGVPILGYRRRSYLVAASMAASVTWVLASTSAHSMTALLVIMMVNSTAGAFSDVVADSIVVERARGESQATSGSLQSLCWGAYAIGQIATAYFSGALVDRFGPRFVFAITASFPAMVAVTAFMVDEQRVTGKAGSLRQLRQTTAEQMQLLWRTFLRRDILWPVVFLFLLSATPSADSAMFFFQTDHQHGGLGFTPEFLGQVQLAIAISSLVGVVLYNQYFKTVPLRKFMLVGTIIATVLQASQLLLVTRLNLKMGLDDHLFVIGGDVAMTVIQNVLSMPTMVLAARMCPEGAEATMFASIMSIMNVADSIRQGTGGMLMDVLGVTSTDFSNLPWLLLICNLALLLPLPALAAVPSGYDRDSLAVDETDAEDRGDGFGGGPGAGTGPGEVSERGALLGAQHGSLSAKKRGPSGSGHRDMDDELEMIEIDDLAGPLMHNARQLGSSSGGGSVPDSMHASQSTRSAGAFGSFMFLREASGGGGGGGSSAHGNGAAGAAGSKGSGAAGAPGAAANPFAGSASDGGPQSWRTALAADPSSFSLLGEEDEQSPEDADATARAATGAAAITLQPGPYAWAPGGQDQQQQQQQAPARRLPYYANAPSLGGMYAHSPRTHMTAVHGDGGGSGGRGGGGHGSGGVQQGHELAGSQGRAGPKVQGSQPWQVVVHGDYEEHPSPQQVHHRGSNSGYGSAGNSDRLL